MTTEEIRNVFIELHESGKIPKGVFKINQAEAVYDIRLMIKTHLEVLKGSGSDEVKHPYKQRLINLIEKLR